MPYPSFIFKNCVRSIATVFTLPKPKPAPLVRNPIPDWALGTHL